MTTLLKLLKQGWFLALLGLALLSIAIWFGGPYLAFGTEQPVQPLASVVSRLLTILVLVVLWALWVQLRQFRSQRAGEQLAKDMSVQASGGRGSADATQLRARFDEAIAALRSAKGKTVNLYELPWFIIIGPPGAGKTTAIANSGLNFPLSKKFGKEALRGVGGTRNCDWWFTDEAILLDTAGRYTTQDSDAESDQAGWLEFLSLLRKHRGRRPINGVIVAMSAVDLMALSDNDRRRHVEAVRHRLEELTRELKINLPVYFQITKLDLVAGFSEFFDDLNQDGRAQVWGTTFPLEASRSGEAAGLAAGEFDQLLTRLNSRMMLRLDTERDVRRRALIFTFPRQFAALRRALGDFVTEAFWREGAEQRIQLRGIYFTSATQEGTPVDRMLGALARTFGLSVRGSVAQPSQGKAYFLQRLLKEVLFKETGLAGINRRIELRQALVNGAIYAAVCLVLVLGLIAFSVSYTRNRAYLDTVATATEVLKNLPATASNGSLVQGLTRLDAFSDIATVAAQHQKDTPLSMRWGLFQGRSMSNIAQDAYVRELNAGLLPAVARHFASRLSSFAAEPDKLYEYLKAYLMLGMPEHLDVKQLDFIANLEWQRIFAEDPVTFDRFKKHFAALIGDASRVQSAALDAALVERARISLKQASLPVLMYSRLRLSYANDTEHTINLGKQGFGGELFVNQGALAKPIPALYTREVFKEVSGIGSAELIGNFVKERWVLGDDIAALSKSPQLISQLMQLYEADYIRVWDGVLADMALRPVGGSDDATRQLDLLSAPTSPLKQLLTVVVNNTRLVDPNAKPGLADKAGKAVGSAVTGAAQVFGGQQVAGAPPAGTTVTRHFAMTHRLLEGSPPPIDLTLQKFAALKNVMADIASGQTTAIEAAPRLALARKDLQTHAKTLPGTLEGIVARAGGGGGAELPPIVRTEFTARYEQQVVAECRELAAGRYPLVPSSPREIPLADFARVFAPNGTYDAFLRSTMQNFVDVNRATWQWKPESSAIGAASIPAQFQRANRIGLTYFPSGATSPKVQFTITPDFLDAKAQRMLLEIDGQSLEYRHGPQRAVQMEWPGPSPGQAAITVEDVEGARPNVVEQGSWALFRLLAKAQIQAQSDTRFIATFDLGGRSVRLLVQANSARNPFGRDLLRGFNCQG